MKRWVRGRGDKKQQVEAWSCGVAGLFINKDPSTKELGYVITHRASGLRLGDFFFVERSDAALVARELTEARDIDWSIKDAWEVVTTYPGLKQDMEAIIKDNDIQLTEVTTEWDPPSKKERSTSARKKASRPRKRSRTTSTKKR